MPDSNEADIPIQQTEGASVVDQTEADADVTELAAVETTQWSSDVAFLNDSGGLTEWRNFTASRGPSIDATQDHLPKLTLSDDERASAKSLDSRAIAQDATVVDKSKLASGVVPEIEGGQTIPGEPPRITDPLPAIPPGIRITIPNPTLPGFTVMDPAVPAKPGISADASMPIKAGVIADPLRPVEPVVGPGDATLPVKPGNPGDAALPVKPGNPGDPKPEFKRGQSVPTEPPKITDPLPKIPPPIQRIVDHGALTGRKSDSAGASIRHPSTKDTTPAEQAVAAFRANLRAAEAQNQAGQNPKLAAQLAAQMELKKLAALNPEQAMKDTAATAAALLARKTLMRGDQGGDKNPATKLGGRPKELGKQAPLQTPESLAAKPSLEHEKTDPHAVLHTDFAASILPHKGNHGIASSLPVDSSFLRIAKGKELIAATKLFEEKGTGGKGQLLEQTVAGKTHLPELTLVEKPHDIAQHSIKPHSVNASELSDPIISKSAKVNSPAFDFAAPTLSEKSKIFMAAHTPIARSLVGSGADQVFAAAAIPQDIKVTSRARHALEPSIALASSGEPTAANTFKSAARSLNFTPSPDDSGRLLAAANSKTGKSLLRVDRGEKEFIAGTERQVKATPLTYERTLNDRNSAPLGVEKLHVHQLEPSADKPAHKIARSLSNGMKTFTLPVTTGDGRNSITVASKKDWHATAHARASIVSALGQDLTALASSASPKIMHTAEQLPVAAGDDTIEITSARSLKPTALTEKSLTNKGADNTASALTMSKSLLPSANIQKTNMYTLVQAIRNADAAPVRETVRKTGSSAQNEAGEKQVARTAATNDHAEIMPAKFAGELKLQVTYLHIGNRVFLLDRRLVVKDSHGKEPVAPPSELIVTAGVAAVIASRRLRRRKKKGDNFSTSIDENTQEEESQPTNDSVQFNRECAPPSFAVTRFGYMIQPGDTLSNLAQAVWQDAEVAWLLSEVNKLSREWQGNECSITLAERQVIELPLPEEVVDFYRSGESMLHKQHKLTTIVTRCKLDEELSAAALAMQFNIPSQIIQHPH